MRFLILGWLCCLLCVEARADYWLAPQPRIFSSEDGKQSVKVMPIRVGENQGKSSVTFFALDYDGKERKRDEFVLVNTPMRVLLPESGIDFFVTLDSYARLGWKHSLVIYDNNGQVLSDLNLEDLLTPSEILGHVKQTISSRHWQQDAIFSFEIPVTHTIEDKGTYKIDHADSHPEKTRLNISFKWGKKISIELATGKVENAA